MAQHWHRERKIYTRNIKLHPLKNAETDCLDRGTNCSGNITLSGKEIRNWANLCWENDSQMRSLCVVCNFLVRDRNESLDLIWRRNLNDWELMCQKSFVKTKEARQVRNLQWKTDLWLEMQEANHCPFLTQGDWVQTHFSKLQRKKNSCLNPFRVLLWLAKQDVFRLATRHLLSAVLTQRRARSHSLNQDGYLGRQQPWILRSCWFCQAIVCLFGIDRRWADEQRRSDFHGLS